LDISNGNFSKRKKKKKCSHTCQGGPTQTGDGQWPDGGNAPNPGSNDERVWTKKSEKKS
jgi:hypothetical protein